MPQVSFYLLPETAADTESQLATEPAFFHVAAKLCADLYQAGQRVFCVLPKSGGRRTAG